jgi:CBS domain-containing protein
MRDHNVGFLPVVDSAAVVKGTLTDRDITVRVTADARPPDRLAVEAVMSREVIACGPEDDIATAEQLMVQFQKSRVLVTDESNHLRGVISLSDIAKHDTQHRSSVTLRHIADREARPGGSSAR